MRAACLLVFVTCCACACHEPPFFQDAGPLVATKNGQVVGKYVKVFDTDVAAFLGIPFAEPPLGEKRFTTPEPAKPWRNALLAHEKPPPCMQHVVPGQYSWVPATKPTEDCLYLNVWAPKTVEKPLPVMVWIHGGAFTMGSTDMEVYDGKVLAAYGPVVVVSMNYRLGIFGFLSGGSDSSAPGNAGLHDQLLAMRWVRENIGGFGGDPDAVTVFGESAGAMSISLHLVSPLSKGLFHRAIMQSGSMYSPPMLDSAEAAKMKVAEFAKAANCPGEDDALRCFREMDANDLAKLESTVIGNGLILFLPTAGDDFMPRAPIHAYESGDLDQGVEVLMGSVGNEGALFLPLMAPEVFRFDRSPKLTPQQAESVTRTLFHTMPKQAVDAVVAFYFQNTTTTGAEGGEGVDMAAVVAEAFGDSFFDCPVVFLAEKLTAGVHLYWLTHQSSKGEGSWLGAHHFSEVAYVFGGPIVHPDRYTPEDARFSGQLIRMWVNFARDGHPLSDQADGSHIWRKFTIKDPVAMELNPRSTKLIPFPRYEVCDALWRHMFVPPRQEHVEAF